MKTILIVDDEPGQVRSLRIGLQGKGYRIKNAVNGQNALRMLENKDNGIDMVITDYAMPGMNGLQLLKQIRDKSIHVPVVMMTAHGEKSLIIEALRNRCDSFIEKPFTLEELTTEIENVKKHMESLSGSNRLSSVLPRIVHRINNPLMLIYGQAELGILNSLKDQAELMKRFEYILEAEEKIKSFNNRIIKFGRAQYIKAEPVDIIGILEEMLALFSGLMVLRGIVLEKDFEFDRVYVPGTRDGLEQVFNNLIMNAIDAMEKQAEKVLTVSLKTNADKTGVRIRIEDTGCGIPENDILRIFEPYFSTKAGGNGLGLAVVKEIVEGQGGDIKVESIVDRGTTFIIDLLSAKSSVSADLV